MKFLKRFAAIYFPAFLFVHGWFGVGFIFGIYGSCWVGWRLGQMAVRSKPLWIGLGLGLVNLALMLSYELATGGI